jgi:hypothetical protein
MGKIQDISDRIAQALGAKPVSRTPEQINRSWWTSHSYTKKEREELAKGDKPKSKQHRETALSFYERQREAQERFEQKQRDAQARQQQQNKGDDGPRDGKII